jgi:hypothetical protein
MNNSVAAVRQNSGCQDTDSNVADFAITTPTPRNSATAQHSCAATATATSTNTPTSMATNTATRTPTATATATPAALNAITSFDAALTLEQVVASPPGPLAGNQLAAADVNESCTISSIDAVAISNFVLNNGGGVNFTGTTITPPGPCAGFPINTSVLVGDPSGTAPVITAGSGSATVSFPNVMGTAPATLIVPVSVSDLTGRGVLSYDFQVTFDPSVAVPASTPIDAAGTLSSSMNAVRAYTGNAGHLIVSAYTTTELTGGGVLLNLRFNIVGTTGQVTALSFADFTSGGRSHQSFLFNEGMPSVSKSNGSITVGGSTPTNTATSTLTNTSTPTSTPTNTATNTSTNTATPTPAPTGSYVVNTTSDTVTAGACEGGLPNCSLRGAIEAADNHAGTDTISFNIPDTDPACSAVNTCSIGLTSALPPLNTNMYIVGPGADKLTVVKFSGPSFRILFVVNSIVEISNLTLAGGSDTGDGGGIWSSGSTLTVTNCFINGNSAGGIGGGIAASNGGTLNLIGSTVSGNTGTGPFGGGIANFGSLANIVNSTISGNSALNGGSGGGIANSNSGSMNLTNSTVSGNNAQSGGGIYSDSGNVVVKNTIVARNSANGSGPDASGTFVSDGFNLIGKTDGSTGFGVATDLTGSVSSPLDPGLDPMGLQYNGGLTKTIRLNLGSAALDKGTSSGLTGMLFGDQRGFPRTYDDPAIANAAGGDGTDIGALELAQTISGTVTYGNAAAPPKYISNATVTGAGSPTVTTTTAAPGGTAGQYMLIGFGGGPYTVSLSKTTGQNGITSNDAARIAQHVAGTNLFTTNNQKVSADVTGNNAVSSQDAAKIAQYVAGLPFSPPNLTGTWRFFVPPGPTFPIGTSPTSRTYNPVAGGNLTGENYIGLLLGETTGNWSNTGARGVESGKRKVESEDTGPERGIVVELPKLTEPVEKELLIPVHVECAANKGVISYEFDLRYDPSMIQPLADVVDVKGTVSRGLSVVANATEPGLLRVVVYGAYPIESDGVLLNLRFAAVGKPGSISPLAFERIMFNEGEPRVSVSGGHVELF